MSQFIDTQMFKLSNKVKKSNSVKIIYLKLVKFSHTIEYNKYNLEIYKETAQ